MNTVNFYYRRLLAVKGDGEKKNDVIVCSKSAPEHAKEHVIYFGGDVQDYNERMQRHKDNFRYAEWSLDNMAWLLANRFSGSLVMIVKPKEMFLNTFSIYSNFVEFSETYVPIMKCDQGGLLHLRTLHKNVLKRICEKPTNSVDCTTGNSLTTNVAGSKYPKVRTASEPSEKNCQNMSVVNEQAENKCPKVSAASEPSENTCQNMSVVSEQTENKCPKVSAASEPSENTCQNMSVVSKQAENKCPKVSAASEPSENTCQNMSVVSKQAENKCPKVSAASEQAAPDDGITFDSIPEPDHITLVGFSKGCTVLNQFLFELSVVDSDTLSREFVSKFKAIYWLDSGHKGNKNIWVTDDDILKSLVSFNIKLYAHVTPYQVDDEMRAWIGKQHNKFVDKLTKFGADITSTKHHKNDLPSLENHFDVLNCF